MSLNFSIIKKHPVAIGGGIIAVGVLFYLVTHSGGGGGANAAAGPSDAALAAGLQSTQMQFAAASQQSQQQFQLAMAQQQISGQLAYAQVQEASHHEDISASLQAMAAQIGLGKYQADLSFQAQQQMTAAQLASHQADLDATYKITKLSTDALSHQSDVQAQVSMFNTGAMADIQKLYISGNTQVQLAQTDASVKITGINADAQKYIAKKQAQSGMFSSALGFAGTALAMFSDVRIKTGIKPTGATVGPSTIPIYSYKVMGVGPTRFGVMAQDVIHRDPKAVEYVAGLLKVNYDRITQQAA